MRRQNLLGGRGPARFVIALLALALVLLLLPHVLRWTASRHVAFPVNEVRDARFVPPYGVSPSYVDSFTVWDRFGRESFSQGTGAQFGLRMTRWLSTQAWPGDVFIEAESSRADFGAEGRFELLGTMVKFGDGRVVRLGPDGSEIPEGVVPELEQADWSASSSSSYFARVTPVFRGEGSTWERRKRLGVRDGRTGAAWLESKSWPSVRDSSGADWSSFQFPSPVAGPVVFWVEVEDSPTSYTIPAAVGASFVHEERRIAVTGLLDDDETTGSVKVAGGGATIFMGGTTAAFTLSGPLWGSGSPRVEIQARLRDERVLSGNAAIANGESTILLWSNQNGLSQPVQVAPADVATLTIIYRTSTRFVAFPMEGSEALLGPKTPVRDLGELPAPDLTISNETELGELLGAMLQTRVQPVDPGVVALPPLQRPAHALTFPVSTKGMTGRDLVEGWLANYPADSDLLLARHRECYPSLSLHPPGAVAVAHPTVRTRIISFCQRGWPIVGIVALVLAAVKGWCLLQGARVRSHLRRQGYAALGFFDAEWLYFALGAEAFRIPPFEQLATVPGVDPTNPRDIVDAMNRGLRR